MMRRVFFALCIFFVSVGMFAQSDEMKRKLDILSDPARMKELGVELRALASKLFKHYWCIDGSVWTMNDEADFVPLKNAKIYVEAEADSTVKKTRGIDEKGKFHIELNSKKELTSLRVHVYVSAEGYEPFDKSYEPKLDTSGTLDYLIVDLGVVTLKRKKQ